VAVFLFGVLPLMHKRGIGRLVIWLVMNSTPHGASPRRHPHYDGLYDQSIWFDNAFSAIFRKKGGRSQFSVLRPLSELLIEKILVKRYPQSAGHQTPATLPTRPRTGSNPAAAVKNAAASSPCSGGWKKTHAPADTLPVKLRPASSCLFEKGFTPSCRPKPASVFHAIAKRSCPMPDAAAHIGPRPCPEIMRLRFDPTISH
jgi:hypothetical protein